MPAKSKSQQRLMGMVHAYKKGNLDTSSIDSALLAKIKKIAGGIKGKSAKEFAKTKHKGLPELKEASNKTVYLKLSPAPNRQGRKAVIELIQDAGFRAAPGMHKDEILVDYDSDAHEAVVQAADSYGFKIAGTRVNEEVKMTFKQFLVEITQKERAMLTPPPAIQKIWNQIKREKGEVLRAEFYQRLASKLNLSLKGLKRLQQLPALKALPFDDEQEFAGPERRRPFAHVEQKHQRRDPRNDREAHAKMATPQLSREKSDIIRKLGG